MSNARLNGFLGALMSKERHLGEPRLASHKLNKRQQKRNSGYKEVSAKPKGYGMAKNKGGMGSEWKGQIAQSSNGLIPTFEPKPVLPAYGVKSLKRFGQK